MHTISNEIMKDNALSVANYFIDLANKENKPITQLGLMKRVYIAHGFSLAINKNLCSTIVLTRLKHGNTVR